MICGSRVQPSLLGEERHERAAEIEPIPTPDEEKSEHSITEASKILLFPEKNLTNPSFAILI